jgi:high-affinity Fe2+/Pb2+ permease
MHKPMMIVLSGMVVGLILAFGLTFARYIGLSPLGDSFNSFFAMVGIIIFFISGFFFVSMKTFRN